VSIIKQTAAAFEIHNEFIPHYGQHSESQPASYHSTESTVINAPVPYFDP
jgi:hypothetical protein